MAGFWLLNTNDTYRPETKQYMIKNRCICAQYEPKDTIDAISAHDVVFIYESRVGIIAYGTADGKVVVKEYEGQPGECHEMALSDFGLLGTPITASEISTTSRDLDGVSVFYAKTAAPLRVRTGMELHRIAKERTVKNT